MNRTILLSSVVATLLVAGSYAGPALADVTVLATITKTKTVTVRETISIAKVAVVFVSDVFPLLGGVAEADAIKNVVTTGNVVIGVDVPPPGTNGELDTMLTAYATVQGSLNGGTGVTGFNQTTGNMVNQGNVVSVAAIADSPLAFINAQAMADEVNTNNEVINDGQIEILDANAPGGKRPAVNADLANPLLPTLIFVQRAARIIDSINLNTGIVDVNQDAGNMNIQNNADAIGIALGGVMALAEADLGQVNSGNIVTEKETVKASLLFNSVNDNTGIVKINQSAGNMNNQANNVAFAVLSVTATIGAPAF
jgi:hypothetical protein